MATNTRTMRITPTDPFTGAHIGPSRHRTVARVGAADRPGRIDDTPMPPLSTPIPGILAWVGSDDERARAALAHEVASANPRSTLVSALNDRIAGPEAETSPEAVAAGEAAPETVEAASSPDVAAPGYDDADQGSEPTGPVGDEAPSDPPEGPV